MVRSKYEDIYYQLQECAPKSSILDLVALIDRKADAKEVSREMSRKVASDDYVKGLADKVTSTELHDALAETCESMVKQVKGTITSMNQEILALINKKASKKEIKALMAQFVHKGIQVIIIHELFTKSDRCQCE